MENKNYYVITTVDNSILERNNYEAQIHFLLDDYNEDGIYIASLFNIADCDDYKLIIKEEFTTFKGAVDYLTNGASIYLESDFNNAIRKGESAKKDLETIKNGFQL
jgi:hypothetical protein